MNLVLVTTPWWWELSWSLNYSSCPRTDTIELTPFENSSSNKNDFVPDLNNLFEELLLSDFGRTMYQVEWYTDFDEEIFQLDYRSGDSFSISMRTSDVRRGDSNAEFWQDPGAASRFFGSAKM